MRPGSVASWVALSALVALAVWIARKTPPPRVPLSGPVQYLPAPVARTPNCTDLDDLEKAGVWPANPKAEQWLRDQVANSKKANFEEDPQFPKPEDRVVSASVLQDILLRSPAS